MYTYIRSHKEKIMPQLNLSGLAFASKTNFSDDEFYHDHSFIECFFICEGSIIHHICDTKETLSTGDGVIIAPSQSHRFERFQTCIHRDNMISPALLQESCNYLNSSLYDELLEKKYIRFHIDLERIQNFEKSVISYINCGDVFRRKKIEKLLVILILGFIEMPDFYENSSVNDFHTQCLTVISENFHKPNAIELITDQLKFNKSYLSKKFRDTFGVTMTEYINKLRTKYAAYLLSITEYPLSHVCELVGLESLPYFNKLFKEDYGITPAKYRKDLKKNGNKN